MNLPKDFFASHKGLRQGDPISPFLFTFVMEGLVKMLAAAEIRKWIKGFNPSMRNQGEMHLTQLLYANDSLTLCDADREQNFYLCMVLLFL